MANVEVIANGKAYGGWKSVRIECGIEQIASQFQLGVSALSPQGQAASDLRDGQLVSVKLDGQTIITGAIDGVDISHSATEHSITLEGRDVSGDLVDCSAMHESGQWSNRSLLDIVRDLVKPYGVHVTSNADLGAPFETWNIEPGESVFENIDRLARHRGVLVVSDGTGGIVITQPGTEVVGTALVLGENILSGQLTRSCRERYSEYHVLGDRQRDDNNQPDSTKPRGRADDRYIERKRPKVCVYEDANASIDSLNARARWQAAVNAARSQRVVITVQGWQHADGLWQPNKQVLVTDARLRLDNTTLLIAGVRYVLDQQGTRTELTLAPRDSFLLDAVPQEIAQ